MCFSHQSYVKHDSIDKKASTLRSWAEAFIMLSKLAERIFTLLIVS